MFNKNTGDYEEVSSAALICGTLNGDILIYSTFDFNLQFSINKSYRAIITSIFTTQSGFNIAVYSGKDKIERMFETCCFQKLEELKLAQTIYATN